VPRLNIDLVANVASLQRDMAKATGIVDKGFKDMKRAGDTVRNLLGVIGIGFGVSQVAAFIKSQIDAAAALGDLSKRLNISVEDLAGFKFVAEQSGTSLESLSNAFKKLQVNIINAETNRELAETLRILGVTAKDPTQAMYQLADAFKALGDRPERTAAAIKLMGRAGDEAIPALANGAEELRKLNERGQQLSGITAESARQAKQLSDRWDEMSTAAGGAANVLIGKLLPAMTAVSTAIQLKASKGTDMAAGLAIGYLQAHKQNIQFLQQQKKDIDQIFIEGVGDVFNKYFGNGKQFSVGGFSSIADSAADAIAKRLALAGEFDELTKKVAEIHRRGLDDQTKLTEKYNQDYETLNRARAAGAIATDRQLGIERLALATQYEQALAELAVKQDTGSKLAERIAAERALRQQETESRLVALQESFKTELDLENEQYAQRIATLYEANQTYIQIDAEGNAQRLLNDEQFIQQREAIERVHQARLVQIEAAKNATVRQMQYTAFQQAAGLLRAFAGESKTAAIAIIAIEKGLGIAQTIINTQVAMMRALAELGPIAGGVAAAKIGLLGKISVGLIAATGLVEASQVGSGGADFGTPANPVNTTSRFSVPPLNLPTTVPPSTPAPITITVNLDGQPILETVQRASTDGRLIINAHSVR
jgi:hypothetical protein